MGLTLRDLENKGLAACAVVFAASMLGGALCGLALFDVLIENARLPRPRAGYVTDILAGMCDACVVVDSPFTRFMDKGEIIDFDFSPIPAHRDRHQHSVSEHGG